MGPLASLYPQLLQALASSDLEDVAMAVEKFGERGSINMQRQAIQLLDCHNEVVAHIGVPAEQLAAITRHLTD